ncbi:TPA: MobC [Yersinia enterocolitica]
MSQKKQKIYKESDINSIKNSLSSLPDVTRERLQKSHVLDSIKSDIIDLLSNKGYTIGEVHQHLLSVGMEDITLKDLKDLSVGKKPKKRATSSASKSAISTPSQSTEPAN